MAVGYTSRVHRAKPKNRGGNRRRAAHPPVERPPIVAHDYEALFKMGKGRNSPVATEPAKPSVKLSFAGQLKLGWSPSKQLEAKPIVRPTNLGVQTQLPTKNARGDKEVIIGFDFGTSTTKVVVTDGSTKNSYAVPLVDGIGVSAFLLPSCLVERTGTFSLAGSGVRHADLKLSMLNNLSDDMACARVCAFMALVLRSVRAWIFESLRDDLLHSQVLWTVALGQPADQATSGASRAHFSALVSVAWALAGSAGDVTTELAVKAWVDRARTAVTDELEVKVMPELSAQIHGFVSSSHFDARKQNIYLMVDVGAGTVDASLFHVRKQRNGEVSFSLFTHAVEAYGAANLHRYRVGWWQRQLSVVGQRGSIIDDLEALRLPTEYRGAYPERFDGYVSGVSAEFSGGAKSPDIEFFGRLRNLVVGDVLFGAWKNGLLQQGAIAGVPYFLCGGGVRHPFFSGLHGALTSTPNATWLSATQRQLSIPVKLKASGLATSDYDRLSVAYGLSQLNPGAFERVEKLAPAVATVKSSDWTVPFTDKSAC